MKYFKLLILLLMIGTPCLAQELRTVSNHSIHVNIGEFNSHVGLGYTYEWAVAPRWTLLASAWMKGEFSLKNYSTVEESTVIFLLHPTISVEPRYYYNFKRRDSKGRSTALNSGSYVGATFSCMFPSVYGTHDAYRNYSHFGIAPHWGMRRVFKNNLFLDFHAGILILTSHRETIAGPDANLKFGYVF